MNFTIAYFVCLDGFEMQFFTRETPKRPENPMKKMIVSEHRTCWSVEEVTSKISESMSSIAITTLARMKT